MWRNRSLLAICLCVSMSFIGIGMVIPVRVLYAQSRGASLAIIGAMASSFLLSNFIFQYPTGWLADMWGRKRMMVFGLASQAVLSLIYLLVADPLLFVGLRFVEGMVAASVVPAARALIADLAPEEGRGEAYGILSAFTSAGFLLGPAIGGLFASMGYSSAFIGSCVFRLVALIVLLLVVRDSGPVRAEVRARARAVPRRLLFSLPLIGAYLLIFGDNLYFGFDLTLMPLWLRHHLGAPVALIGLAYAVWALPNMVASPVGGRVADRVRRSTSIFLFGLLQVPLYLSFGLLTTLLPLLILFAIHGFIYGLMMPSVDATVATASPVDARARVQGLYSTMGLAGAFVAASFMPWMYGIDYRLPLFIMGAGIGVSVLIGGVMIRMGEARGYMGMEGPVPASAEEAAS